MTQNIDKMDWFELHPICLKAMQETSRDLNEVITTTFAAPDDPPQGSLASHYRGRLKWEGLESLIAQMDNNGMRRLIKTLND